MNKSFFLMSVGLILFACMFLLPAAALAGDPGSQSANWYLVRCGPDECEYSVSYYDWEHNQTRNYCQKRDPYPSDCRGRAGKIGGKAIRHERSAVSKTVKGIGGGTTSGGLTGGGDSSSRFGFSFFGAILISIGGLWSLFVLIRERFARRKARMPVRAWAFVLKPSVALSSLALLISATVIGSFLTSPAKVTAEKHDKRNKLKMTGDYNPSNKPVFKSAQQIGGDLMTQIGAPVFDAAGNRYVRGAFSGVLTIGGNTLTATAGYDLFFAKYDPDGNPLWARQAAGARQPYAIEGATSLAVDAAGSVYIGGSFVKQATFQGGANTSLTLHDSGGNGVNYESFIVKYDGSGNLIWARGGNTGSPQSQEDLDTGQNTINNIVFDANGNLYVTGSVAGNNFLGSPISINGHTDVLIAKLDPANGAVTWRTVMGGSGDDNGLDLKLDATGNLYVIGNYGSPQITFPNGQTFTNQMDSGTTLKNSTNTFIAKFDQSGANVWAKSFDNPSIVGGSQIAVNAAGEVVITGYFFNAATFDDTELYIVSDDYEADSLAGYVAKLDPSGNITWVEGFIGIGQGLTLDPTGRIYLIGTFFDGGTFGADTPNEDVLASFGGQDLFVARFDTNGGFEWAKPIASAGYSGTAIATLSGSKNYYFPFGLGYNPARQRMFIAGDFTNAIALDCITLTTAGDDNHQSFLAELTADDESASCRIWNGLDEDDNDFDSPDNWNANTLPNANDSVYVPYSGYDFDPPTYNPKANLPLNNLTIADDRILTLEKPLTVNGRLDMLGGFIDAETFRLDLGPSSKTLSISDGLVLGGVRKQFAAGSGPFTFPVGTAAADLSPNYSPVTLSNVAGAGTFTVAANEGAYLNAAAGLPADRARRWWTLTNGGLPSADLTFKYIDADITAAKETKYRLFKIDAGSASQQNTQIDVETNTATTTGVTQFSDWTLAVPTATAFSLSGRVLTPDGAGLKNATVSVIDANGVRRSVTTTSFGFYQIDGLALNAPYTETVSSKRYRFVSRSIQASSDQANVNFVGLE